MGGEPQELSEAVAFWLHYQRLTGLKGLLNESSMTLPIAEFLSVSHKKEIYSEMTHPLFKQIGGGRPRQIVFVRKTSNGKAWAAAYECKFDRQDFFSIINDLCRLVCLAQARCEIGSPERNFIFATRVNEKKEILSNGFNTGEGERRPYFDGILSIGRSAVDIKKPFKINNLHTKQRSAFRTFCKNYRAKIPSKIVVELKGWCQTDLFACGVWKIRSSRGAKLLGAEEISG